MSLRISAVSILSTLATTFSLAATAADAPNMLGVWTVTTDRANIRVGTSPNAPPDSQVTTDGAGWRLEIQHQDGRTFYGVATGPVGKPINVIGAFRNDGKRFVLATDNGNGAAEMVGDRFELCWADTLSTLTAIDCAVYTK